MLFTKSIKAPKELTDGLRVSVMSRHTLADGNTPDPEITSSSYDEWWKQLAPPDSLVGAYYKRGLSWEQFETQYISLLQQELMNKEVQKLIRKCEHEDMTLLCAEKTPERCHRRLLAEECLRLNPELEVVIQ